MCQRSHASAHTCTAPLSPLLHLGTCITLGTFRLSLVQQSRCYTTAYASLQLRLFSTSFLDHLCHPSNPRSAPDWRSLCLGFAYDVLRIRSHSEADEYQGSIGIVWVLCFWQVSPSSFLFSCIPTSSFCLPPMHTCSMIPWTPPPSLLRLHNYFTYICFHFISTTPIHRFSHFSVHYFLFPLCHMIISLVIFLFSSSPVCSMRLGIINSAPCSIL